MTKTFDRKQLEFISSVKQTFRFLIDDYGFQISREELTRVRYESNDVFVNIYHGRLSYEIGFECGLKCKGENSRYRLPTILKSLLGSDAQDKKAFFQVYEKDSVYRSLKKLASLVKKFCIPLIRGDEVTFARVRKFSCEDNKILTEEYFIRPIKEKAEQAWIDKDFGKVKSLYESIKGKLSTVEEKRYKYACKHSEVK